MENENPSDVEFDSGSESTSGSESADSEEFDDQFIECYKALKNKDSRIYDKDYSFFNHETNDEPANNEQQSLLPKKTIKTQKVTIIDQQLTLANNDISEQPVTTTSNYEKQLQDIKSKILSITKQVESEDDESLIVEKDSRSPQTSQNDSAYFSKNLDVLPELKADLGLDTESALIATDSGVKRLARIPRNATSTVRDLLDKQKKKEKRLNKLGKKKKLKYEEVEDFFQYNESEPIDYGLTPDELIMVDDSELEKWEKLSAQKRNQPGMKEMILKSLYQPITKDADTSQGATKKKRKKKRKGLKVDVAPDRLLAYGVSKNKLRKSNLLE